MRIYISIPISHLDAKVQRAKAAHIAEKIKALGHEPVSPFDTPEPPAGMTEQEEYAWYMGEDIKRLLMCDAVYFCKFWPSSKGCTAEMHIAQVYGIKQYYCTPIDQIPKAE